MFDLEKEVRNLVWTTFWLRWIDYFKKWLIENIEIYFDNDYISIDADILWTEEYYTSIWIKLDKSIWVSCTCPAFDDIWVCKHISWLAMKVSDLYTISDTLIFINKKTWKILDYYDDDEKNISILDKPPNNLSIFSQISNNDFLINIEKEEYLYKIKLWFEEKPWKIHDIYINLYKSKVLKDWKLSSWANVKREWLIDVPYKFLSLSPFLDTKNNNNNYYYSSSAEYLTFNKSWKTFINTLFEFSQIYDEDNKLLNLHKEIYDLKIEVKKEKDLYHIWLFLLWKNKVYTLFGFRVFWNFWNKYFAVLTWDNHLLFFKTDLNYHFISELSKKEIILNQDEFRELKTKKEFIHVIENTSNLDSLDLEYENIDPQLKLIIEIPNDYSYINTTFLLNYDNIEINSTNTEKDVIVNDNKLIKRNKEKENEQIEKVSILKQEFDEFYVNIWKKYVDDNLDKFFDEIENIIEKWIIIEYKQKTKRISTWTLKVNLKVKSWIDFFDIQSQVLLWDKELSDANSIISLAKRSWKFITLENWNTIILKNDISKTIKQLDSLWIDEKDIWWDIKISKYNIWLLKDKTKKWDLIDFELDKEILELKNKFKNFKNIEKVEQIKKSKIILRDYQKIWFYWINFLKEYNFSWILADDMWLWKTIQTLVFLEKLYFVKETKLKTLIICPTSLVFNWLDEAQKFTPQLKIDYIRDWKTWFDIISKDTQIIIVSYGIMANLVDNKKVSETFEYVILDESQNIKNPQALRTKSICKLKSKNRLALSWTPIENNLIELWSIFNFLMPWFLWTLTHFKSNYSWQDKETLDILSRKIKPFILRRTKEEVLKELPPKVEEYIKLEMWDKQKAFYNKLKNSFKLKLEKKIGLEWLNKTRFEVLDALLKLRQACLMPELVAIEWNDLKDSIKLEYIDENIEDMIWNWHNLLIFSQFTWFLAYVQQLLNKKWIKFNYLDWKTQSKDRKKLVDSFNSWDVNVFIISLKAGWTWLNLTSADYIIHLDPWWNPAVENQATDRAHRMWQKKTVFVQKLIVKDSIEEKILLLQENKKKLIEDIFSWNFSWALDKNDIDFIFS